MARIFETIENTLTLVGYSIRFAFNHKQLLIVPLIRSVAVILASIISVLAGWLLISTFKGWQWVNSPEAHDLSSSDYILAMVCFFIFIFFVTIVSTLGELILSHAIGSIFRTGQVSLKDAMAQGFRRFGRTVTWATTHALIHILALRKNNSMLDSILGDLFVLGWNLATLFIIPVFAFDDLGVYASIERSAEIFENHFGKAAVAEFSFSRLTLLLFLIPFVLLPGAVYLSIVPIFLVISCLFVIVACAFVSLAHSIFTTALYFHAVGESTGELDTAYLEEKFIHKNS